MKSRSGSCESGNRTKKLIFRLQRRGAFWHSLFPLRRYLSRSSHTAHLTGLWLRVRHHRLKRAYGLPTGGLFENGTALKIGPAHVAAASTARKEARDTGGAARQQSKFVLGNSTEPENTVRRRLRKHSPAPSSDGRPQDYDFFFGEFDSGSERTLAAWMRHASRTVTHR